MIPKIININRIKVFGEQLDTKTRCIHYRSHEDIIAIKMKCCNKYYACYYCHLINETHDIKRWNKNEITEKVILCGNCRIELSIAEYLNCSYQCPNCNHKFNSRCALHQSLYFDF